MFIVEVVQMWDAFSSMEALKAEKNNLLLVINSFNHVNHGEEVALASELELRCG